MPVAHILLFFQYSYHIFIYFIFNNQMQPTWGVFYMSNEVESKS